MKLEDKIKDLLEGEDKTVKSTQKVAEAKSDVKEHMSALFEGQDLSEDFKQKATTIFEAAVQEVAEARMVEVQESFQEQLEEAVSQLTEDLVEQIDGFLDLVVEKWMEDNSVAVENGLRSEIVGNFINGLKDLFTEHYIDVPDEQVDILGEQADMIESQQTEINALMESQIALQKEVNEMKREKIIENVCYDLTQVQKEKVKALAENVEMISEEEFTAKVKDLKESYAKTAVVESVAAPILDSTPAQPEVQLSEAMSAYTRAISSRAKF